MATMSLVRMSQDEYCINNLRTYLDKKPTVREPENIFDLIIFGDDFVDFEIHELDMEGNDVSLQKIECEKILLLYFHLFLHLGIDRE